uniref:FHF complex subunit HOOK-interacting protein C-terminal domain-containing protein n=1 Tax=Strigamia maritima TaxID=126957 RepID=T1IIV5_STRMM
MLSRLSTVLHNAVDALAPPIPLVEEFIYHWKAITNFFVDKNSDSKAPVEETNIVGHLKQMLQLLMDEEEAIEIGSTGPCMEYLLHHKLLDTLYTIGRADCPPGMKQQVLIFFSQLLTRIKQPMLPHISVHRPVQRLVKMCGEVKAAPTEAEEVQFVCIICAKLKDASHLVNFFMEPTKKSVTETSSEEQGAGSEICLVDFPLVNSLITLCQSADNNIILKACEGLLLCSSLQDDSAASSIINRSSFCDLLIDRLCHFYGVLPAALDPNAIELVEAKWGLDAFNFHEDVLWFSGKRQLISFLSWLDFCDQLMKEAHPLISDKLASSMKQRWLIDVIEPVILEGQEPNSITAVAYITRCIQLMSSKHMLNEFAAFLFGDNNDIEIRGLLNHPMKKFLIEKCNSESHEIAIIFLKLFECFLEKYNESVFHNLVLINLLGREYFDHTLVDFQASWSDEEDERIRKGFYDSDISPGSSPISRTLAPSNIHKIINCFLLLLPDELKSCDAADDVGYENYLRDAHRQFRDCATSCAAFNWPREAITREEQTASDTSSAESQPEADTFIFFEGSFLQILFDKLEQLLEQPYELSLQVTSIVSKLALLPHPYLHEYLLNPLIPQPLGSRSLFSVLEKLASDVHIKAQSVPQFKRKLYLTRQDLLGESGEFTSGSSSSNSDGFLEGIIVLEEFCKELAAIAFVKYHAS